MSNALTTDQLDGILTQSPNEQKWESTEMDKTKMANLYDDTELITKCLNLLLSSIDCRRLGRYTIKQDAPMWVHAALRRNTTRLAYSPFDSDSSNQYDDNHWGLQMARDLLRLLLRNECCIATITDLRQQIFDFAWYCCDAEIFYLGRWFSGNATLNAQYCDDAATLQYDYWFVPTSWRLDYEGSPNNTIADRLRRGQYLSMSDIVSSIEDALIGFVIQSKREHWNL